jgi:hypothetical protein
MLVLLIQIAVSVIAIAALLLYAAAWVQRWRVRRQIKVRTRVLPIKRRDGAA